MQKEHLKRYLEAIYNRCFRILQDSDLAWDALQDVFETYYKHCTEKEIDNVLAYLYRMSTNRCLNMLRQRNRILPLIEEWHTEQCKEDKVAEERLMIESLTDQFGAEAIGLLVYRHVDQMTYREIGEVVGMTDRGIKKKLERIEAQIRTYLQKHEENKDNVYSS